MNISKECKNCGHVFPSTSIINGRRVCLNNRSYCLNCSPFNSHKGYDLRKGVASQEDAKFAELVGHSTSIRQLLFKMGLVGSGGNYQTVKDRIKRLNLDNSHFTGQSHLKGKTHNWSTRIPLESILVSDSSYRGGSYKLKNRLLKEGILTHKCYNCELTHWLGKTIPLELEHINGNKLDNRINNLTLLCPNCHAFTPTYRGKNIRNKAV